MKNLRNLSILLAALLVAGTCASCAEEGTESITETTAEPSVVVSETEEVERFSGIDFGGAEVRMLVSTQDFGGIRSSSMAIWTDDMTGEVVADAVYQRNAEVEEQLNVKFSFTENTEDCFTVPATLTRLVASGEDAYELIIHNLYPLATQSIQKSYLNVREIEQFDFSQPYWYTDYMKETSFASEEKQYLLAGDYFLDVLRSAHALYFNKDYFRQLYGDPEILYDLVFDGAWTHEKFMEYSNSAYQDINGDGNRDKDDRYGFSTYGYGGPVFPWIIGSDIPFLKYDSDGTPSFAMDDERCVKLLDNLFDIFYGEGTYDYTTEYMNAFVNGNALFGGYLRVGSLELFRDMDADIGILPIPKMDDAQDDYITSTHDTTCVGAIPVTCSNTELIGTVLELLAIKSAENVVDAYYETALKDKYARDNQSIQILDIIRYNVSCVFPMAYGSYCNNFPIAKTYVELLRAKKDNYMSNYEKHVNAAQIKLDELWEAFSSND